MRAPPARRRLFPALAVAAAVCASCGESYSSTAFGGALVDGGEASTGVAFSMNGRPVKLEVFLKLPEKARALVMIDHPDGRTTDSLEIDGPGIREVKKEFPKEPGSWGLRLAAKGGDLSYWVALHDRKKFVGPSEEERRAVDGGR